MKISLILFLLLSLSFEANAQDYLELIAQKSCECVEAIPDSLEGDYKTMKMGLCIMGAADPYKSQIKRDYKIDLTQDISQGQELGQIIGLRMASVCPETLLKITKSMLDEDDLLDYADFEEEEEGEYGTGIVQKIEEDFFVTFQVKDDEGKTEKIYWMDFVEGDGEFDFMGEYKSLVGKDIYYIYEIREMYDPRIAEYREFKVMTYIELEE